MRDETMAKKSVKRRTKKYIDKNTKAVNNQTVQTPTPPTETTPNNKKTLWLVFTVIGVFLLTFAYEALTYEKVTRGTEIQESDSKVTEDTVEEEPITTHESVIISVSLSMYTIPENHEVEVVLKNTASEKAVYNLSSDHVYLYKILNESGKEVKKGTFGIYEKGAKDITLNEGEEYKATLNYGATYEKLEDGNYTLEVVINSPKLSNSKASTTLTVSDFDPTVSALMSGDIIIRAIDLEKNTLQAIVNGLTLVNFSYGDELKKYIKGLKVNDDIYQATYVSDKGVNTLQTLTTTNSASNPPNVTDNKK